MMDESVFNLVEHEVVSFEDLATIRFDAARFTFRVVGGGEMVLFAPDSKDGSFGNESSANVLIEVLTGSLTFVFGTKPRVLVPGELLHLSTRSPHTLRANDSTSFLLTFSSPVTIRSQVESKLDLYSYAGI